MCDDPNLTAQQILQRLNDTVSRFYRENKAQRSEAASFAFEINLIEFLEGVTEWGEDLPQLPPHRRGEGNTQTLPSKNRLHVIKELEQVSAFLLDNADRPPNQPLNLIKLEGRQLLSSYACRELVHRGFGALAIVSPVRSWKRRGRLGLSETRMSGWNSEENGVHRIKRAFTAAARDRSIKMHGLKQLHDRLDRPTFRRLVAASGRFHLHVRIVPFVARMDRAAMEGLALSLQLAARDMKTAFGLWERNRDPQLNKTVTDFEKPAPLYQFVMALLEQGWPCFGVADVEDERLMAGDSETGSFEKRFAELISQIVECTPRLARELYRCNDFDPLVGIDAGYILKKEGAPPRGDRRAWQSWAAGAARHFAARIVKAREQIVILRDYAETTRRLNEDLAARALLDNRLKRDRDCFNRHGKVAIYAWLRECDRQYRHGIFYPRDRNRGEDYFEVSRLKVNLLRDEYPRRHQAGPRFADVPVRKTKAILHSLDSTRAIRWRLGRILSRLEN
jgi:hypothetical protein